MAKHRMHPSPQLYQYLRKYQEDPGSRVFAPLAEAYRKAGLAQEAVDISREGLKVHPNFVGGRVALARALFDLQRYEEVIQELAPVAQDVPDNLVAQRLLAESSLMLGRVADALAAYKMLLYFNPSDPETSRIVSELETQAYERGALVLQSDLGASADFSIGPASGILEGDPDRKRAHWVGRIEKLQRMLQRVERYRSNRGARPLTEGEDRGSALGDFIPFDF